MSVVLETTVGDLTLDLYLEERPKTCMNFMKLCKTKAYNMNLFHMVQPDFIAQTGDPAGTGRGGDSVFCQLYGPQARYFEAETVPRIKHTKQGLISMVNCGDNMLGSQFFLTLGDDLDYLDNEHCVFGEVVEGEEILEKFNSTIVDGDQRPYQDIRITHTVILHDPYPDPSGLELRSESPEPTEELLKSSRIGADENINDYAGKTDEEINEIIAEKEAKARATILEMVGDLPDADVAPPENVLFLCKLNPVTSDDDLEIIFSRFGKVKCCEVIRDRISLESLQYAFVEFEDTAACEQAYFKMDNVLIDDRRIHVDFSQSVSKYRWKGKGRLEVNEGDGKEEKGQAVRSRGREGWKDENDLKEIIEKERRMGRVKEASKNDKREKSKDRDNHRERGYRDQEKRDDRDRSDRDRNDRDHYRNNKNDRDRKDKDRSDRDKDISDRDIHRRDRDKERSDRDKERSDRDKERSDRDIDRSDRDMDRSDRDKVGRDRDRNYRDRGDSSYRNGKNYSKDDKIDTNRRDMGMNDRDRTGDKRDKDRSERTEEKRDKERYDRDRSDKYEYDRNGHGRNEKYKKQRDTSYERNRSDEKHGSNKGNREKHVKSRKRNNSSSSENESRKTSHKAKKNKSRYSSSDSSDSD